jgi:hypothetical protein
VTVSSRSSSHWNKMANVDSSGSILIAVMVFFASLPILFTPILIYHNFDPSYVIMELIIPSFVKEVPYIESLVLPSIRFCGVLLGAAESCRILSFMILWQYFFLKYTVITISFLTRKAKVIIHQFQFLLHFTIYKRARITNSMKSYPHGQIMSVLMGSTTVITVITAYLSVALHSSIQTSYYLIFPMSLLLEQVAFAQILTSGVYCYEGSSDLIQLWNCSVLKSRNRRYMVREIRSMTPIKFFTSALNYNFFFLRRSTIGTSFNTTVIYTVNAVLLLPANNLRKLLA